MQYFSLFLSLLSFSAFATPFTLTESTLIKMSAQGSPRLEQIEAAFLASQLQEGQLKENFAPELFAEGKYAETNEKAIIPFQPVFSPVFQAQVGVRQDLSKGLDLSASLVTDQRSAGRTRFTGKFNDVTTTDLRFTVQMDLWRNLLGRVEEAQLQNAALETRRAQIEKAIQEKAYQIAVRRVFWALVGNQESQKIYQELLRASQKQLSEVNLRFKNAVAEADEVARNRAQVAAREAGILRLQYQRQSLLQQLKNLVPELSLKEEIAAQGYDIQKTINEVMACTATIATQRTTPFDYTLYDETISLLKDIKEQNRTINSRYAGPDVKLYGTVKTTGVGSEPDGREGFHGSYGAAREDIENSNRSGYEVGVSFVLPLGDVRERSQEVKKLYDEKRLQAQITQTEAQVINTHSTLVKTIEYLNQVNKQQKISSEQLQKRLGLMRKKYQQARVSINDVINDQDAFLNAELTTIDTRLAILNTIFDYLVVFTDTPCELNRK